MVDLVQECNYELKFLKKGCSFLTKWDTRAAWKQGGKNETEIVGLRTTTQIAMNDDNPKSAWGANIKWRITSHSQKLLLWDL